MHKSDIQVGYLKLDFLWKNIEKCMKIIYNIQARQNI